MRTFTILLIIPLIILFVACKSDKAEEETIETQADTGYKVSVEEVIQSSSYTYLKVTDGDKSYWIATAKGEFKPGMTLYYDSGLEMSNFESKDLSRTFESILFVDQISDKPIAAAEMQDVMDAHAQNRSMVKEEISVTPAEGGITIGHLYAERESFKDQTVNISGMVIKFNPGIMGRNWVHIQDGSESDGKFDLTVTTNENVKIGDTVTFSGVIALNKDFGAGYTYEVIMENARIIN